MISVAEYFVFFREKSTHGFLADGETSLIQNSVGSKILVDFVDSHGTKE